MRTVWLVTPGSDRGKVENALASDADVVFPCLEDGTPYTDEAKREARRTVADVVGSTAAEMDVYPRINALTSRYWRDDVDELVPAEPDGLIAADVRAPEYLSELAATVLELEREHGLPEGEIPLACLIEHPNAVRQTYEIASAVDRMVAVIFGADDFTQSLGAMKDDEKRKETVRSELNYPRSKVAMDGGAAGRERVDSAAVFVDEDYIVQESSKAARLGFTGKIALHPNQVEPIKRGFAPTATEVERSREIVKRHESDVGGTVDGALVVEPVVKQSRHILELADELGTREAASD